MERAKAYKEALGRLAEKTQSTEAEFNVFAKEEPIMEKDPVCGMEVDEKRAAATSTYKEKTYYFCAKGCAGSALFQPESMRAAARQTSRAWLKLW